MYSFRYAHNEDEVRNSLELRYRIYCKEKNWVDPTVCAEFLETDRFDKHSRHYLAFDSKDELVGSARLIFETEEDGIQISAHPGPVQFEDFSDCAELSRLIAIPDHRKGLILLGLIRIVYADLIGELNYLRYLYVGVDTMFFRVLRRLGFDFVQIGEPEIFYGDELLAARISIIEMDGHVREANTLFHKWLHEPPCQMSSKVSVLKFVSSAKRNIDEARMAI